MKIAIASDEISFDFETAVSLGLEWGIDCFELKRLSRKRIPDVEESDVKVVEDILKSTGTTLTSLAPGLFKDPLSAETLKSEMARLDRTIALAHRFGVDRIVIFSFGHAKSDPESGFAPVIDALGNATRLAASEGLTLLIENEHGFWVDSPDRAAHVVKSVGLEALALNWDVCNALGSPVGAPYPDGYEMIRPFVRHMHVKDARLKEDGSHEYVVLGQGDVDWLGQFRSLLRDGYDGYCVLEPHFGNRVASSRAAASAIHELVRQAKELEQAS